MGVMRLLLKALLIHSMLILAWDVISTKHTTMQTTQALEAAKAQATTTCTAPNVDEVAYGQIRQRSHKRSLATTSAKAKVADSLESMTVLRDYQEAGVNAAAKSKLSELKGTMDQDLELKFHRQRGTKFVELDARLQDRVVDIFADQESVIRAAHAKVKETHPELHSKFLAAQAKIKEHEDNLAMLQKEEGGVDAASASAFLELLDQESARGQVMKSGNGKKFIRVRFRGGLRVSASTPRFDGLAGAIRSIGDGFSKVGDVIVKSVQEVSNAYKKVASHVGAAVAAAGAAATNWAKAGYQWASKVSLAVSGIRSMDGLFWTTCTTWVLDKEMHRI